MNKKSILIVDDDLEIREALGNIVQSLEYECEIAENGQNALHLIRQDKFDLIISDIRMPGMDGLELLREVQRTNDDIPFIMITGCSKEYSFDDVIEAGASDFMNKPFTVYELKIKVNRIFKERQLALQNKQLLEEQISINKQLLTLQEIALDLTSELDFDRLFELIVGRVTKVLKAERTSLYIIDWDRQEIWTKVAEHVDLFRLPIGEGISGRVAKTGEIVNVDDARDLPYFNPDFDIKHNFRTKSILCIPLYNRANGRIAVIQVMNKIGEHRFNENDVSFLKALASQIAIALENSQLVKEVRLSFESAVRTLSATVDAKHHLTAGHSERVTEYSIMIAEEMGFDEEELEVIKYAGLLHDIGKIGISDKVLLKYGAFTPEERAEMNTHPVMSRSILENFRFPKLLCEVPLIASCHHEKVSGKGYPDGLTKEDIPLYSRIIAVADVFDALTSPRDYPKYTSDEVLNTEPMPLDKAISLIKDEAGAHFDTHVIEAFLKCLLRALIKYRGSHFPPKYVDDTIRNLAPEFFSQTL